MDGVWGKGLHIHSLSRDYAHSMNTHINEAVDKGRGRVEKSWWQVPMMMGYSYTPIILLSTCKDQGILHVRVLYVWM